MRILTENNECFSMNELPSDPIELRFGVLDYSDQKHVDYYFYPLIFLETFTSPSVDLQIGPYRIQLPLDWSILVGDKHFGDLEMIGISQLNGREYDAFCFNPINGFKPDFYRINILNIYSDIKWFLPKLKYGHLLVTPLMEKRKTSIVEKYDGTRHPSSILPCMHIAKEVAKIPDRLDLTKII